MDVVPEKIGTTASHRNRIAVLTGAGMSAESGLKTFRDAGGLWEGHAVEEVASVDGWIKNPDLVLDFYNQRRTQAWHAEPNEGHRALVRLESCFDVTVITQNVDNLHEKAGSSRVLHLHGELSKVRSTGFPDMIYTIEDKPIFRGDTCENGFQLRPHIVWFGEPVPMMEAAAEAVRTADIFLIIGTSLVVYPAASLIYATAPSVPCYLIDPGKPAVSPDRNIQCIQKTAATGTPELVAKLIKDCAL